jgi:NO-binding membrane sensor protein with MHYT domain
MAFGLIDPDRFSDLFRMKGAHVFLAGNEILQSHDPKLVLLAAAICALGSFITLFLFAQAREMTGQGRSGWLFLAGFSAGAVMWTTHFVALLAFQPNISIGYDPALTGGAFFVAVLLSTIGLAVAAYGPGASGLVGGGIVGLAVVAMHFTAMASLKIAGKIVWNPTLLTMGAVLCITCGILAIGRARNEGRNVQFIAPILLAAGVCIMHFVGMAAIDITPSTTIPIPPKTLDPTILGYFVAAMTMLLVGTGAATMMIARGARKEAQTQLRNIADASVEGLILSDGSKILDINESFRALIGPMAAAKLGRTTVWQILDYNGDRAAERFEAQLSSDSGRDPSDLRDPRPARAPRCRAAYPVPRAFRHADRIAEPRLLPGSSGERHRRDEGEGRRARADDRRPRPVQGNQRRPRTCRG